MLLAQEAGAMLDLCVLVYRVARKWCTLGILASKVGYDQTKLEFTVYYKYTAHIGSNVTMCTETINLNRSLFLTGAFARVC